MMSRKALVSVLVVGLVPTLVACKKAPVAPPAAMVGHWEGRAEVAVNWCNAKELPVALTIAQNGTVAGKVGDAVLKGGQIYPNPGKPPAGFTLQTKYVIEAELEGPLVASEGIKRDTICMPVEVNSEGKLAGAMLTSGKEYGGKDEKIFSAGLEPLTKSPGR
jgi:hypothetical protein